MSISVRPATPADRETCIRLLIAQLFEHDLSADPVGIDSGVDLPFIPHSPAWLLLAEVDGVAAGVVLANQIVSVEKYGYTLWVEEFYVVPEARRQSVATAFLDYIAGAGRRRGVRAVELEVVPTQAAAFALYRRHGFREVHRQRMTWNLVAAFRASLRRSHEGDRPKRAKREQEAASPVPSPPRSAWR
jgi:GNAT superfamily N-acetyltransferase